jgi:bacteriocin biosynthesis cyclodehydratase domain-containing protein
VRAIPVDEDRVLLKRGLSELVVGGDGVIPLVQQLLALLDGSRTVEDILASFSADERESVVDLMRRLVDRGLVTSRPEVDRYWTAGDPQLRLFREFSSSPEVVDERLRSCQVAVVGSNLLSIALLRSLAGLGIGAITAVHHGGLDSGGGSTPDLGSIPINTLEADTFEFQEDETWSAIVATSDFGEAEALLEVNRWALRRRCPFLPVWLSNMVGYVGPLTYPFETACLRCYRLRLDANDPNREIHQSIRDHLGRCDAEHRPVSAVAPMVDVLAGIAAMELLKMWGGFVPSDVVGRSIEVNLVSFHSVVRRVLKVPRCPDCSETMNTAAVALTHGPRLPQR